MQGRRLAASLAECLWRDLIGGGLIELAAMLTAAAPPLILRWLLAVAEELVQGRKTTQGLVSEIPDDSRPARRHALLLIAAMVAAQMVAGILINASRYKLEIAGAQAKVALTCLIMDKAFLRPPSTFSVTSSTGGDEKDEKSLSTRGSTQYVGDKRAWSSGSVFNLASMEASRVEEAFSGLSAVWTVPLSFVLAIPALAASVDLSAVAGTAVLFAGLPVFAAGATRVWAEQLSLSRTCQRRVSCTQQLVQGIRAVKLAGWAAQAAAIGAMCGMKMREMVMADRLWRNRALMEATGALLPTLASVASLAAYEALRSAKLDPARAFSSLALFLALKPHISRAAQGVVQLQELFAGCRAIEGWLECEEPGLLPASSEKLLETAPLSEWAMEVQDAVLTWPETSADDFSFELTFEPGLRVRAGQVVAICGGPNSGKSSLLAAVSGQMCLEQGIMQLQAGTTVALAGQSPWIQRGTLRSNILFGRPFDASRYSRVVDASALSADLDRMPLGDMTVVGTGGQGLSSGQAQRVSIARALYSDADVVLIDDCLRNLDPEIARAVFEDAICGFLKGKTCFVVANQAWVAGRCDCVLWVDNGHVTMLTSLEKLEKPLASILPENKPTTSLAEKKASPTPPGSVSITAPGSAQIPAQTRQISNPMDVDGHRRSFMAYLRLFGGPQQTLVTIGIIVAWQTAAAGVMLWLASWTTASLGVAGPVYMAVFLVLGFAEALLAYLLCLDITTKMLVANRGLWERALRGVAAAPLSFFHSLPLGAIMDRLCRDVDTIDRGLIEATRNAVLHLARLLGGVVLMLLLEVKLVVVLAPGLAAVISMITRYTPRLKDARSREAKLRADANAALSDAIDGSVYISTYHVESQARSLLTERLDVCNNARFLAAANMRWLEVRLDAIVACIIAATGILVVATTSSSKTASPATVGIIMGQILALPASLRQGARFLTAALQSLVAVDRLTTYATRLTPEDTKHRAPGTRAAVVGASWPEAGEICLQNVSASYPNDAASNSSQDTPTALHDITLTIPRATHIAVVGPTGAGKSTLVSLLMRLLDPTAGTLAIDGVSIQDVPLNVLRSRIAAVPHDVAPLPGCTLRENVDPARRHSDDDILQIIAALDALVEGDTTPLARAADLDAPLAHQLSAGTARAQLLGLARVLLQKPRVCVLDEALGTLNGGANLRVTQMMRGVLRESTVIMVTHHVEVAMDFERVLVIDGGRVQAYGKPLDLWNQGGFLRGACDSHGGSVK